MRLLFSLLFYSSFVLTVTSSNTFTIPFNFCKCFCMQVLLFGSFSRLLLFAVDGSHFAFIVTRVVGVFCLYLRSVYVMIAF